MQITKIVVEVAETFNLGDYNNTRPAISIHADLHPGDDVDAVIQQLYQKGREHIESRIDASLMVHGQPPKFYTGDRFDIWIAKKLKLVVVMPSVLGDEDTKPEPRYIMEKHGMRNPIWSLVAREWPEFDLLNKANKAIDAHINHRDSLVLSPEAYPWIAIRSSYPEFQTELDQRFAAYEAAIAAPAPPASDSTPNDQNDAIPF
ncbi:hypothetical protein [Herpetosiphon geysericola]|uniref:Uncharacterized protein n=1 Tax=Herpetosiphon geysericola TaxID=70996 RepID=A0A0P6YLB7_9CHLR|nr:hypothetical protein [Herpetosiphon geysericola]KPL90749.1 hypothetical protein SE18_05120 [Herpetosiphon geysericola]